MRISNGKRFIEFKILGYEFSYPTSDKDYDPNWLIVGITYGDGETVETYSDQCLLTWELEEIVDELNNVIGGSDEPYISQFLEPYLKICICRESEKIAFAINYVYDAISSVWKERRVVAFLSNEEAEEISKDLRRFVELYPER